MDSLGETSPSGVHIAANFRDNLIIDRYDRVFSRMRASKLKHLRSENSEDVVTWNVFRSLRQIDPAVWLPKLQAAGLPGVPPLSPAQLIVHLWREVEPPPALLIEKDEGASEIDIVLEAPTWVWFIEAKYKSDISEGTTTRPGRDQVLRNLDVGSYYAGVREFFFSLLVRKSSSSPRGVEAVEEYKDLESLRALLKPHRPDLLENLHAPTLLTWATLAEVLLQASVNATHQDERDIATRASDWMKSKGLAQSAG